MNRARALAWALGGAGTAGCVLGAAASIWLATPASFLLIYAIGVLLGLLGALVAARAPRNSVGWLMIALAWLVSIVHVAGAYGYAALVIQHNAWPLGSLAAWLGGWIWVPSFGFLALIAVRFPDGDARRLGRLVDWSYMVGTGLFALAIALDAPATVLDFAPLPGDKARAMLPFFHDPIAFHPPLQALSQIQGVGLILILLANVVGAASPYLRYRSGRGDERLQIKWFVYAGSLCALAVLYGGVAWNFFGQPLYLAFTPLEVAGLTIPVAIGIAVLRYRLYDIDLIINRTLVYGGATAVLGAIYAGLITFLNRFFIAATGQRSDAAYVLTAFGVVVAFSPVKDWLQRQVDRRIRHASPATVLDGFRADVEAVVSVMDVDRVARRLLDQAIEAFDARGAALYLDSDANPHYERGHLNKHDDVEVAIRFGETRYGRLVMGSRRGNIEYTERDVALLQSSADSVGEALALAAHLGFRPRSKAH